MAITVNLILLVLYIIIDSDMLILSCLTNFLNAKSC